MYRLVLGISLFLAALSASAAAEPRLALVIGVSDYRSLGTIEHAETGIADAKLMAQALEDLNFTVKLAVDTNQKEAKLALREFAQALVDAGPEATGLFYFSGRGAAISGEQFLLPTEALIEDARDVDLEAMSLDTVIRQMEFSGCRTKIVILETDRFNPFNNSEARSVSRSGGERLGAGFILAHATAGGELRPEARAANHPFTAALTHAMRESNIDITLMLQSARREVVEATGGAQVPSDTSTLLTSYFFRTD